MVMVQIGIIVPTAYRNTCNNRGIATRTKCLTDHCDVAGSPRAVPLLVPRRTRVHAGVALFLHARDHQRAVRKHLLPEIVR